MFNGADLSQVLLVSMDSTDTLIDKNRTDQCEREGGSLSCLQPQSPIVFLNTFMHRVFRFFVSVVVLACSIADASAQTASSHNQLKDPRPDAKVHFGPFFIRPGFQLTRFGYDSRVSDSDGDTRSDFVIAFGPNATVWVPLARRALVTTSMSFGVTYFSTHKAQSSTDPGISVKAEASLFRFVPFVQRSIQQAWRQPTAELDIRVPLTTRSTSAGVTYSPLGRTSVQLSGSRTSTEHGATARYLGVNLSRALNDVQQGIMLRVDRRVTTLTKVHFSAENHQDRFELDPKRNMAGARVAVGADFGKKAFLLGKAEVGFQHMSPETASFSSFTGVVANVDLERSIGRSATVSSAWSRSLASSFISARPYYVDNNIKFRVRQQLGGSIDIFVGPDFGRASYVRSASDTKSLTVANRLFSADLGVRLTRDARVGVVLTRVSRSSELTEVRSFSGLRIGLSFSAGF